MKSKFITPVSMPCTKEQFERDLRTPLIKLGYEYKNYSWQDTIYLTTGLGTMFILHGRDLRTEGLVNLDHYNPELFLALAAMTEGKDWIIGEWVTSKDGKYPPFRVTTIEPPFNSIEKGWAHNGNVFDRKATKEELIEHLTKTNTMENKRFPLKLSPKDAKRIIRHACSSWQSNLAALWGLHIVLEETIDIHEYEYNKMRKACTRAQHDLFDEIFGKDIEDSNPFVKEFLYNATEDVSKMLFGNDRTLQIACAAARNLSRKDLEGRAFFINVDHTVVLHKTKDSNGTVIEIIKKDA